MWSGVFMEAINRLQKLSALMGLEPAEEIGCPNIAPLQTEDIYITNAATPNGKHISLLKTLLTSTCESNCNYCPFRAGRDYHRTRLIPDEMAKVFMSLHRAGIVEGIFLSSGLAGGSIRTQDNLIDTIELLRNKHNYTGYVHLKIMPGAERSQVERIMQIADRVSVNLEAPNTKRLEHLAPRKEFMDDLIKPIRWIEETRQCMPPYLGWNGRWPSITTQFVVGPAGESDYELLVTTAYLHKKYRLSRAYFKAFTPVPSTPFENKTATLPKRELRLYQASFLLRDYKFQLEDLPFETTGSLPLECDPKTMWASLHLSERPVELNIAAHNVLLRIPGIGPKGAKAILSARKHERLKNISDLRKIGINPKRAIPFILINGKRPEYQLSFI